MRAYLIVVSAPALNDDLGFFERVEDLTVEQLISQASIEAFHITVLPRAPWFDVGGRSTDCADLVAHRLGYKLRAVVGADVGWHATQNELIGQNVDHVD